MKKIILMACISTLSLTISTNSLAKIYKWTDAKGVTHYSATLPASAKKAKKKVKNIEQEIRFAAGKPHSAKRSIKKDSKKQNKEEGNSKLSPPGKKLVDYCKTQESNLYTLRNNFRNVWVDKSGKKTKLTQKQRQQKVNYLEKLLTSECSEVTPE